MPFYEYECSICKHHTEVLQKISDTPLRKCPSCGKQALKRLISAPVFRLKGGGWYETDFKSDGEQKRNLAGGEDASEPKAETKSEDSKSTDAKPAEKAETKTAESKPAEKAASGASRSTPKAAAKSAARPAVKPAAKPKTKTKAKPVKKKAVRR
jgi:putative FmdB family regulatory protein